MESMKYRKPLKRRTFLVFKEQSDFLDAHPLLNKSDVVRNALQEYIRNFDEKQYQKVALEIEEAKRESDQ